LPFPFVTREDDPTLHDALVDAVREVTPENLGERGDEIDHLVFEAFRIDPGLRTRLRAQANSPPTSPRCPHERDPEQ